MRPSSPLSFFKLLSLFDLDEYENHVVLTDRAHGSPGSVSLVSRWQVQAIIPDSVLK